MIFHWLIFLCNFMCERKKRRIGRGNFSSDTFQHIFRTFKWKIFTRTFLHHTNFHKFPLWRRTDEGKFSFSYSTQKKNPTQNFLFSRENFPASGRILFRRAHRGATFYLKSRTISRTLSHFLTILQTMNTYEWVFWLFNFSSSTYRGEK